MKTYNGHRSWNAWNVALWLHNDQDLYADWYWMVEHWTLKQSVRKLLEILPKKTPDGATYNALSIRLAIEDDFSEVA